MKRWIDFMGNSSVVRLMSYVERRGYYTESERRAVELLAASGMAPWVVADKMYEWMVTGVDALAMAEWMASRRQQTTARRGTFTPTSFGFMPTGQAQQSWAYFTTR